jgi:hypothetical protein
LTSVKSLFLKKFNVFLSDDNVKFACDVVPENIVILNSGWNRLSLTLIFLSTVADIVFMSYNILSVLTASFAIFEVVIALSAISALLTPLFLIINFLLTSAPKLSVCYSNSCYSIIFYF